MIRLAIGYVAVVVICALVITLNPMDFMGRDARAARVAEAPATGVVENAETTVKVTDQGLAATTAAILANLTQAAQQPQTPVVEQTPEEKALMEMSVAALNGLRGAQGIEQGAQEATGPALETIVAQALLEGKSDAAIDTLVNDAAAQGQVEVPGMLVTAEGRVDTAVLLASILAQAQLGEEFSQGDASDPTEVIEGGTMGLQSQTEDVIYTVTVGDSLGSLALRFYGDAALFPAIFQANRQVLASPESLRYGMKLLIPARSKL